MTTLTAVETRYIGATETKPTRMRVRSYRHSMVVPVPVGSGTDLWTHQAAMEMAVREWYGGDFLEKFDWVAGGHPDGAAYVWVAVEAKEVAS